MNYPLRYPLSLLLARLGVTISIEINFIYDDEVKVFIATSKDIPGLVLETENFNDLKREVEEAIPNLFLLNRKTAPTKTTTDVIFRDHIAVS
ncbi:MAG: DUF1902 domain-containing protein [Methyloprofundus sp.]|nr:DUF1902 domain-containing protein [Methyloprofundus sp.]